MAQEKSSLYQTKPNVPAGIHEFFAQLKDTQQRVHYEPRVVGIAKLHFVNAKNKVDVWEDFNYVSSASDDGKSVNWEKSVNTPGLKEKLEKSPLPESTFGELPSGLMQEKNYPLFEKALAATLYQNQTLTIYQATDLNMTSKGGESEVDFRIRVAHAMHEKRDDLVKKMRDKNSEKIASLTEKVKRAQEKSAQKQQKAWMQKIQTLISFITTFIGALFGRGVTKGTISQTGTSIRRAGQISKDNQVATQAEENLKEYQQQLEDLKTQMNSEISAAISNVDAQSIKLETISVRPRKSDIAVERVALVWWPK